MRVILFSGSHPRHVFVHQQLIKKFDIVGIVSMKREDLNPSPPAGISNIDEKLFKYHFERRTYFESKAYGNASNNFYSEVAPTLYINPDDLNSKVTYDFVKKVNPDVCFIFGVNLILNPVIGILPKYKINLHLGLSPWYRGSATLFWPFYFLQPQFAGSTTHLIVEEADAGDIIHQDLPKLEYGDSIHEVGTKVVLKSCESIIKIFNKLNSSGNLSISKQKSSGRLFLTKDFHPSHLRLIYQAMEDKIVDMYLDGILDQKKPKIIIQF